MLVSLWPCWRNLEWLLIPCCTERAEELVYEYIQHPTDRVAWHIKQSEIASDGASGVVVDLALF